MRISDWSSDVCSSDLPRDIIIFVRAELTDEGRTTERLFDRLAVVDAGGDRFGQRRVDDIALSPLELRAAAGSEQGGEAEHDEARARGGKRKERMRHQISPLRLSAACPGGRRLLSRLLTASGEPAQAACRSEGRR